MKSVTRNELLKLLEKAYEEGWHGTKDMAPHIAENLVKEIKPKEGFGHSLLQEANILEMRDSSLEAPPAIGHSAEEIMSNAGIMEHLYAAEVHRTNL